MRTFLLLLAFLSASFAVSATHLMGGVFQYSHLGNGVYDIKLTLHIDNVNANPGAIDPTVLVGLYNAGTSSLITTLTMFMAHDTIGTCQAACGYCVRSITYTLSPMAISVPTGGLLLTYDRCCKNGIINNVAQPGSTGTLITALIPAAPNSSPVFNTVTPPVIFTNQLNTFDASATDADGDELRYRLDELYQGSASVADPTPAPGILTISTIPWQPPYSKFNMLGGSQPLQIDSVTGQMTAIPSSQGFFQIAYRVEEYRNGQLIGYIRNEVQVFVGVAANPCLVSPTGITETVEAANLRIVPNPFTSRLTLTLPDGITGKHQAVLSDATGRELLRSTLTGNGQLSVPAALPAGIYLLQVITPDGLYTAKVVKE